MIPSVRGKIVHSVPEWGWGLAEIEDERVVLLKMEDAIVLHLRGTELVSVEAESNAIPAVGEGVVLEIAEFTVPRPSFEATIVHSVPGKGWGLAEMQDGKIVFLRVGNAFFLKLAGSCIVAENPSYSEGVMVPRCGTKIVFSGLVPAERCGNYDQAFGWMSLKEFENRSRPRAAVWTTMKEFETMQNAALKAKNTLAKKVLEEEEAQRQRRFEEEERRARNAGKGGGKKGKKSRAS